MIIIIVISTMKCTSMTWKQVCTVAYIYICITSCTFLNLWFPTSHSSTTGCVPFGHETDRFRSIDESLQNCLPLCPLVVECYTACVIYQPMDNIDMCGKTWQHDDITPHARLWWSHVSLRRGGSKDCLRRG